MIDQKSDDFLFSKTLIDWYKEKKRDLPWRNETDPYRIWLSEIILQQTRVNQGMEYYLRIVDRFQDIRSLAEADEDEVLKYWQGLGYYSRARNLHAAAKTVLSEYGGEMPSDYNTLLKLKGIGEYTAAAVSSFVENAPHPVVDGNVYRFLSRYFSISEPINTNKSRKIFTGVALQLMDKDRAGLFNQAIMEFGALQCTPSPNCGSCPFGDGCLAKRENKVAAYPVKRAKAGLQVRYLHYFHITMDTYTFLYKRVQKDIWRNLYEFPMIETEEETSFERLQQTEGFRALFDKTGASRFQTGLINKKQILSHRILYVNVYEVQIKKTTKRFGQFIKIKEEDIGRYAVHRLMADYISKRYR